MKKRGPTTRAERAKRSEQVNTLVEYEHVPVPTPKRHLTDEELLLVAVLHRGLLDYATVRAVETGAKREPRDFDELRDACAWVHSTDKAPFSFEYCCWQGLGEDPAFIRSTVQQHWQRLLKPEAALIFANCNPPRSTDDADL